jgi:gliding motility-associated-like protein
MMNKKDELIDLLRDRLGNAEAHVDPSLWQGIQARMAEAAIASGADPVTELFRNGLKEAEVPVDPSVWAHVSSQLGHGVTAGTSLTAWVGGGLAAAVVVGGLWLGLSGNEEPAALVQKETVAVVQPVVEQPVPEQEVVGTEVTNMAPAEVEPLPSAKEEQNMPPVDERAQDVVPVKDEPEHIVVVPSTPTVMPEERTNAAQGNDAPKVGPDIGKVQEIITQVQEAVISDPQPSEPNDPQIPPTFTAPTTEVQDDDEQPAAKTEAANLFIPNVFTPNNDGVNDELEVSAEGLTNIRVSIYSATTDKLMYRASDLSAWDGRDPSGVLSPEGYYFYAIEAMGPDGNPISKGQVVRLFTH